MPNLKEIIEGIEAVLELIFGNDAPPWIIRVVGYVLLFTLFLCGLWGLLFVLSKIKKLWIKEIRPIFYDHEEKRRRMRRQRFADHIEGEIRRLNRQEEWADYRFAELEAEVEAEGKRYAFPYLPFLRVSRSGLRREKSLSKALESSQERLILLEGDPGSGKSVTMRYLAQSMARRAMQARSSESTIPLYINLKHLARDPMTRIDRNLIEKFVLKSLNRANDRDIEEFLEEEFERGMRTGTWLFLFDSFDEIPEVLSSTETDDIITRYTEAIEDFLGGMNRCRGIIASRQFRGPKHLGWPKFRVLPLSEQRRKVLVQKADLPRDQEIDLLGQLEIASESIRFAATNPMFLGLLCEYVKSEEKFPTNAHGVLGNYIETRLDRDASRIERRFMVNPREIRRTAEVVAFCMTSDSKMGLSPTRNAIRESVARQGFNIASDIDTHLDALEYIKLARSETQNIAGEEKSFTFAHRRFQEYFSTCVVLQEKERVSPYELLTDARWRETTVVLLQTQPLETLGPLLHLASKLLKDINSEIPHLIDNPLELIEELECEESPPLTSSIPLPQYFPWPSHSLHILGLLQSGFSTHLEDVPYEIQINGAQLLVTAFWRGTQIDKKWGLEVAGIVPEAILLWLLRTSFATPSQWLREAAYRQTARLSQIPNDIAQSIRSALVNMFAHRQLYQNRFAIYAHLNRLEQSKGFLEIVQLLIWIPRIAILFCALFIIQALSKIKISSILEISFAVLLIALPYLTTHLLAFGIISLEKSSSTRIKIGSFSELIGALLLVVESAGILIYTAKYRDFLYVPLFWIILSLFTATLGRYEQKCLWPFIFIAPIVPHLKNLKMRKILYGLLIVTMITVLFFALVYLSYVTIRATTLEVSRNLNLPVRYFIVFYLSCFINALIIYFTTHSSRLTAVYTYAVSRSKRKYLYIAYVLSSIVLSVNLYAAMNTLTDFAREFITIPAIVIYIILVMIVSSTIQIVKWGVGITRFLSRLRKLKSCPAQEMDIEDFLMIMSQLEESVFQDFFMSIIREQKLLRDVDETELVLADLILYIEALRVQANRDKEQINQSGIEELFAEVVLPQFRIYKGRTHKPTVSILEELRSQSATFKSWALKKLETSPRFFHRLPTAVLEELYLLFEQTKTYRVSSGVQAATVSNTDMKSDFP